MCAKHLMHCGDRLYRQLFRTHTRLLQIVQLLTLCQSHIQHQIGNLYCLVLHTYISLL